jgi:hypothetical protein
MEQPPLRSLTWNEAGRCWSGRVEMTPGRWVDVAVLTRRRDPTVALALARQAFPRIQPRLDEARSFAAAQLQAYYNAFNAHLRGGEQVSETEFAARLELEAIEFKEKGSATLYFGHRLYRGFRPYEGGLIVVFARSDGEYRKAAWISAADAEDWRSHRYLPPPRGQ